jgi:hypothetical protein
LTLSSIYIRRKGGSSKEELRRRKGGPSEKEGLQRTQSFEEGKEQL